jgi:hypothetical protein
MLIADNITHFARVLRTAGLQVGPDRVLTGIARCRPWAWTGATTCAPRWPP